MARRTTPPQPLASAQWKEPVATQAALPSDGNLAGDIREVLDDGDGKAAIYQWGGSSWVKIADPDATGGSMDSLAVNTNTLVANLSGYESKVGVGTATPETSLHIQSGSAGTIATTDGALLTLESNEKPKIHFQSPAAYGGSIIFGSTSDNDEGQIDYDHGSDRFLFKTGGSTKLAILGDNVGVGVSDPDQKLEVGGVIHVSTEVASPSAPSGGDGGNIYVKSDGRLYYLSDTVSETDLSSGGSGTVTSITPAADSGSGSAITTSGTFTYTGGTGVTTSVTGTTVTIDADNNGTVTSVTPAADAGSGTAITGSGTLTYTGGTNVTTSVSGTTVTINSTDQYSGTVTSVTPAADAGSGTAITSTGTITVSGTSNEISTSVSGTTVTVGLPTNVSVSGTLGTGDAITAAKAANSDLTALVLTNNDATADAAGMVSIQFNLNDVDDDKNLPAGKIQVSKEATWTSDDNTHDSQMRFELAENGTQAEVMTISSGGNLTIDGDLNLGTDQIKDSGTNVMLASDGSGNVTLAAASKTISLAGLAIHSQGVRQAMAQISAAGPTSLNTAYTWIDVDCSSNTVTLNLPTASSAGPGFLLYIQDFNGTVNSGASRTCVINRAGSDTIGGAISKTISNPAGKIWLISNGTNGWGIIDEEGT